MNMRFKIALMALLAGVSLAMPVAVPADAGQTAEAGATTAAKPQASASCPAPGDKKLNLAQVSQTECCKGNKGICGCRAGKIICCDRTASEQPGCTCHGDDGFLE